VIPDRYRSNAQTSPAEEEIDLHSLTADEAIPKLDDFIYKAFKAGYLRVWVVHGKGEMRRLILGGYLQKKRLNIPVPENPRKLEIEN
jgi:DNA-nicking Smr family endonuclease